MDPLVLHQTVAVTRRAVEGARARDPVTHVAPARPDRRRRRARVGPDVLRLARAPR